jgi:prepilin-type N-terminal cleavage/methylation domain-containing protein
MTNNTATSNHSAFSTHDHGFTLLEMTIVISLMAIIFAVAYKVIGDTENLAREIEVVNQLGVAVEKALTNLKDYVLTSRRIFSRDQLGPDYLSLLDMSGCPSPLADSQLPVVLSDGSMSPDDPHFDSSAVGNKLLFARELPSLRIELEEQEVLVDRVRMYYIFPTRITDGIHHLPGENGVIDLMLWESITMLDYTQLSLWQQQLSQTQYRELLLRLWSLGYRYAWNVAAENLDEAFFEILTDPPCLQALSASEFTMEKNRCFSLTPDVLGGCQIMPDIKYSIASNKSQVTLVRDRQCYYAQMQGQFPAGVEVLVVGPSRMRRVLIRLIMVASYQNESRFCSRSGTTIASARDLGG